MHSLRSLLSEGIALMTERRITTSERGKLAQTHEEHELDKTPIGC